MTDEEFQKILKQIRYNRQMQKKRLYDQARRAARKEKEAKRDA